MAKGRKPKGAIENLKDSLYSRSSAPEVNPQERTPLMPEDIHPPVAWQDGTIEPLPQEPEPALMAAAAAAPAPVPQETLEQLQPPVYMSNSRKRRLSLSTKFFIGSFVFFLVAAGVAAYMFFYGGNLISPQNIDMQIVAPSIVDGGKPATLEVIIDNRNQTPLQLSDLILDYPDGTRDPNDQSKPLTHDRESIGTIAPGQQLKRTVSAVFYGQEGQQQQVSVTLEYTVPGSNSIFQKQIQGSFILGSSPVAIAVDAPTSVVSDQPFGMDVTVTSNSPAPIQNLVLEGQYPFGYTVSSANPQADAGGTLWHLGTLAPGASQTIHIDGAIAGQDGDQRVFRFMAGTDADPTDTQVKTPFIVVPQTLTVEKPFVSATLALNGQSGKTVAIQSGQSVNGTITYTNNLSTSVSNLQLSLVLGGPMLDPSSVQASQGFYQSSNSTIVWGPSQVDSLASVPPGGTGTLNFSFSTLPPASGGTLYTNPTIDLTLSLSGERADQAGVPQTVASAASVQATLASSLELSAQALHFTGPFTNSGPMPPIAEQKTTYTILFTVKNTSNSIAGASVSTVLPPYVDFVAAQAGSGITYDAQSRTVTWPLGDVKAGAGYSSAAQTGAFQVSLQPSVSQVGQSPALTGAVSLTGQDRFAQTQVSASAPGPTTSITGESSFTPNMSAVAPKQ